MPILDPSSCRQRRAATSAAKLNARSTSASASASVTLQSITTTTDILTRSSPNVSRPSTPSSFAGMNRPPPAQSESQSQSRSPSPPAYSKENPLAQAPKNQNSHPAPRRQTSRESSCSQTTRTWRIEFAMQGNSAESSTPNTPSTAKVCLRLILGALMGIVGVLVSLGALFAVNVFPFLRPKVPEHNAARPAPVKLPRRVPTPPVPSTPDLETPAHQEAACPLPPQDVVSPPTSTRHDSSSPPILAPQRHVSFHLGQADTVPEGHGYLFLNSPGSPDFESQPTQSLGDVGPSSSPAPITTDSQLERRESGKLIRRFMRRRKSSKVSSAAASEDERDTGYYSACSTPSTPFTPTLELTPTLTTATEDPSKRSSRRISIKLPSFKRRVVSTPQSAPPAKTVMAVSISSPDSIGHVSLSSNETTFSGITDSSTGSGKKYHKHSKSASLSVLAKGAPVPLRTTTMPMLSTEKQRTRKLSLDDSEFGVLQLNVGGRRLRSDAGSDKIQDLSKVMAYRGGSTSQTSVDSNQTGSNQLPPSSSRKKSVIRGSKPPVTLRPTRHEMTRLFHEQHSYSDTEAVGARPRRTPPISTSRERL